MAAKHQPAQRNVEQALAFVERPGGSIEDNPKGAFEGVSSGLATVTVVIRNCPGSSHGAAEAAEAVKAAEPAAAAEVPSQAPAEQPAPSVRRAAKSPRAVETADEVDPRQMALI